MPRFLTAWCDIAGETTTPYGVRFTHFKHWGLSKCPAETSVVFCLTIFFFFMVILLVEVGAVKLYCFMLSIVLLIFNLPSLVIMVWPNIRSTALVKNLLNHQKCSFWRVVNSILRLKCSLHINIICIFISFKFLLWLILLVIIIFLRVVAAYNGSNSAHTHISSYLTWEC